MFATTPLEHTAVTIVLHYISPSIQSLPQHLVASQLAFRQSMLKLTPDDPAYIFWPSSDDQHVIDALESFQQRPIDDIPLDFDIRYTADDSLFAHVRLTPDDPKGLRLIFQWEDGIWKDGDSGESTLDSYWDSYGGPAPDHEGEAVEFERETTGSYWDLYNSVQGSGDSVIPSPVPEKQQQDPLIPFSYADMHPTTDPIESLSDRLEALSRRTLPSDDDTTTVVSVNGTSTNGILESEVALKESLRGVWKLWKSTRGTPAPNDKELFLSMVQEVLAEL
ncbi:hypothetical protein MVEN_01538200 [Mycena venus]|uniref:Uncharacterized protein n=1 Tax=Mycena venus TaxID=2733690 RepID=A0A8H6XV95_9AGAR|nr:hypothetical protein MVEN_01538200 [Mycena venus]